MTEKVPVAINFGSHHMHYNDHLAAVCNMMGMPLLQADDEYFEKTKKFYPGIEIGLIDYMKFSPEYLVANYDVLFMSDLFDRDQFHERFGPFEEKYDKVMRHVHCPHGFSDKGFFLKQAAREDILLAYGQNMLDMFSYCGVKEKMHEYVLSGNMRYTYYKKYRQFFDDIAEKEVFSQFDKKRPTILYAPTWLDYENSTSFFNCSEQFFNRLPDDYNLLVKIHPRLELDDNKNVYRIIGRYEERKNIAFIIDFPVIYPLLERSDIYIGDMSSIGYDFLTFNRPMYFLNHQGRSPTTDYRLFLYQCGITINPMDISSLFSIIAKTLPTDQEAFSKIRQEIYSYTFGNERPFSEIKEEVVNAYNRAPAFL